MSTIFIYYFPCQYAYKHRATCARITRDLMRPNLWTSGNIREVDGMSGPSHVRHATARTLINKTFEPRDAQIIEK